MSDSPDQLPTIGSYDDSAGLTEEFTVLEPVDLASEVAQRMSDASVRQAAARRINQVLGREPGFPNPIHTDQKSADELGKIVAALGEMKNTGEATEEEYNVIAKTILGITEELDLPSLEDTVESARTLQLSNTGEGVDSDAPTRKIYTGTMVTQRLADRLGVNSNTRAENPVLADYLDYLAADENRRINKH